MHSFGLGRRHGRRGWAGCRRDRRQLRHGCRSPWIAPTRSTRVKASRRAGPAWSRRIGAWMPKPPRMAARLSSMEGGLKMMKRLTHKPEKLVAYDGMALVGRSREGPDSSPHVCSSPPLPPWAEKSGGVVGPCRRRWPGVSRARPRLAWCRGAVAGATVHTPPQDRRPHRQPAEAIEFALKTLTAFLALYQRTSVHSGDVFLVRFPSLGPLGGHFTELWWRSWLGVENAVAGVAEVA
jgi:hypothetical protein